MDVPGHSSLGHLVFMLLTALASGPCFPSSIASLAREPRIQGLPLKPHPLSRTLISLGQELRAWLAEEEPRSLLGAPSLSGLGSVGLQRIQLPHFPLSTAQTTRWPLSHLWGQGLPTVSRRCLGKVNPGFFRTP